MNLRPENEEQFPNPLVFDGETLGLSLRELGVDIVHADTTDIMSRWFHSVQDADLFIYSDSQQRLLKLQICFFGQVVEWNPIDGTRTGLIIEMENSGAAISGGHDASEEEVTETIQFDSRAQSGVITQAMAILKHVTYLSEEERSLYCYNLTQSPRLHKHARERALKTWAPKADEISSLQRPKFWKRLKTWVLG